MKFFTYSQNNSGGVFELDLDRGITHYVIIEATDKDDADRRAEDVGLYWDGCEAGIDCECCGDRWSRSYFDDGTAQPEVYGVSPHEHVTGKDSFLWMEKGREVCVHYANGRKSWY